MGFGALALLLPQAGEARGGTQLQGFRLLVTRYVEGLLEAGVRLGVMVWGLLQEQLSLESMQLRLPPALSYCVHYSQRVG